MRGAGGYILLGNFNPHSREGSDSFRDTFDIVVCCISIHTPAKGVTNGTVSPSADTLISIHTPAKGVTDIDLPNDHKSLISIHTPAKGVTIIGGKEE